MEFFNKKEDVIDLQLTQFGRHLLAKGKFKPTYYAFYDDNIMYNGEPAGLTEDQNRIEERIKEAQTIQPQVGVSSLEKEFANNYEMILSGDAQVGDKNLQRTADKNYVLPQPIGTSDINAEYAPSWSVRFLNGHLTGSVGYLNLVEKSGGKNTLLIPQLETEVIIETSNDADIENNELIQLGADIIVSDENEMFVLLKVTENNGLFQRENFDIEIYEVQDEVQDSVTIESMRPLQFFNQADPQTELEFIDVGTPEPNKNYAEYYFDIFVDDEISDELLCQLDPVNETMGVFSDPRTKECQDILNQQKKKVFNIYDDGSDTPGEIC